MIPKIRLTIISFLFAIFFLPLSLIAAPLETVTNINDAGPGSLRQAIADVDPGGDVVFNIPGTGPHTILISDTLFVTRSMRINGPGENILTIDKAGGAFRTFVVADGLQTNSIVIISGITIDGSNSLFGGIINGEDLTLNNIVITRVRNAIVNIGGQSDDEPTVLTLNASLISGNSNAGVIIVSGEATLFSGGIATINQTTISDNQGPGIFIIGPDTPSAIGANVTFNQSIITQNQQGIVNEGGFAAGSVGGTLEVRNSTITNNNGDGIQTNGGMNGGSGATTRVSSSTINGNAFIGLINFGTDPLTEVKNSIVSQNAINDCGALDGTFTPIGVNFSTDNTCPAGFTQVAPAALNLGPLQNNGGPTDTRALIPPSVAIDSVSDCTFINGDPVFEDQRGFLRPQFNCDAGAFEFGAQPPSGVRNVPTLSEWGLLSTTVILLLIGIYFLKRNKELV